MFLLFSFYSELYRITTGCISRLVGMEKCLDFGFAWILKCFSLQCLFKQIVDVHILTAASFLLARNKVLINSIISPSHKQDIISNSHREKSNYHFRHLYNFFELHISKGTRIPVFPSMSQIENVAGYVKWEDRGMGIRNQQACVTTNGNSFHLENLLPSVSVSAILAKVCNIPLPEVIAEWIFLYLCNCHLKCNPKHVYSVFNSTYGQEHMVRIAALVVDKKPGQQITYSVNIFRIGVLMSFDDKYNLQ